MREWPDSRRLYFDNEKVFCTQTRFLNDAISTLAARLVASTHPAGASHVSEEALSTAYFMNSGWALLQFASGGQLPTWDSSICLGEQVRGKRPRAAPRVLLHAQPGRARARPVRMLPATTSPTPCTLFPSFAPSPPPPALPSSFTNSDRCSSHREPYIHTRFHATPLRT